MLDKSHPLIPSADIRQIVVKEKKKNVSYNLILMLGSLSLAIDTRYNFVTTTAMKTGKRHFYSDHSNGC